MTDNWGHLWKLTAASALSFLAGYPPTWFVLCVFAVSYSLGGPRRWKMAAWTSLALASSLLVAAIQVIPALDAAAAKMIELSYGSGLQEIEFYVAYLLPNYFDLTRDVPEHRIEAYLYLGAPAIFGLICAIRRCLRNCLPLFTALGVVLVLVTNPFHSISTWIVHSPILAGLCRSYYFLAGITLALSCIAAAGLNDFLKRPAAPRPRLLTPLAFAALLGWAARQLWLWQAGGTSFSTGWLSALDAGGSLLLFTMGLGCFRVESGWRRAAIAAALLLAVAADYKAFGTSKKFNAHQGDYEQWMFYDRFRGLDNEVYKQILANNTYRVALDPAGPNEPALRYYGLTTAQGFDPLLPERYRQKMKRASTFRDHTFDLDPGDTDLLRSLGVRYYFTAGNGELRPRLLADKNYRLLEPSDSFYRVFELLRHQPPYRWAGGVGSVEAVKWEPERRELVVDSPGGGRFVLVEQFFPGWRASIDGQAVAIEPWEETFQSVQVQPGLHRLLFEFQPRGLWLGVLITVCSLIALCRTAIATHKRSALLYSSRTSPSG